MRRPPLKSNDWRLIHDSSFYSLKKLVSRPL